jgi:hypothetical protein
MLGKESFAASFYMVLGENSSCPTRANYGENRRQLRKLWIFGPFSQPRSRRSHRVRQTNHGECPPPTDKLRVRDRWAVSSNIVVVYNQ